MISILVPYRSGQEIRDANWQWLRQRLEALHPSWEICEGEDSTPEFSRSRALNDAARRASGDVFYITDADTFVYPEQAWEAIYLARETPGLVVAAEQCVALQPEITETLRAQDADFRFNCIPFHEWIHASSVGSCAAISREAWEKVGGYPPEFVGWGFEDNAFCYSLEAFYGRPRRVPGSMFHLWHPSVRDERAESFARNRELSDRYGQAISDPEEMRRLLEERSGG